ncbi:MAG: serine/threonine-protein kinase, partial [Candidatus Acidiferrum sp.]
MELSPEKWETIKSLFEAALEEDSTRRSAFLQGRCPDATVRAEVERLLAEHDKAGEFLSTPALANLTPKVEPPTEGLLEGTLLAGRFLVVRFIAGGGMGEVYEAEDQELRERVAIKTIRPEVLAQPNAVARFRREVHLARKVTHPNVCRIFDLFRHKPEVANLQDETVFISMELLNGKTLAVHLKESGRLSEIEALPLVRQMASALAAAHSVGVVHRDFKPGNVVLVHTAGQETLRPVVTDFGLAVQSLISDEAVSLSTGQGILGTPAYMAPEQLEGRPSTAASDIYAFGLVIYEMVTGARPFHGETPASAALKRLSEPPTPPRQLQPGLSLPWETAILRCLERDPARRFSGAEEVVGAISGQSSAGSPGITARNVFLWQVVSILTVLLIVGIGIGYALHRVRARTVSITNTSFHPRRSVAVLGFKNLSGRPEVSYLSTALSEMTTSELAAGGELRTIPGETVSQMKISLALPDADTYGAKTLKSIRRNIGCDDIIVGAYLAMGNGQVRVDLNLEDATNGELLDSVSVNGDEVQIANLVSRAGANLRSKLGAGEVSAAEASEVKATLPSNAQAARLYADGLTKMRSFENVTARD